MFEYLKNINPVNKSLSISGIKKNNLYAEIIDLQGKVIKIELVNNRIDVNSIKSGIYFLRLIREGRVEQKKFVKL